MNRERPAILSSSGQALATQNACKWNRGFIALVPIPKGRKERRAAFGRAPFGLGHWVGAQVGSHRCPILRPVQLHFNEAESPERGDRAQKSPGGPLATTH